MSGGAEASPTGGRPRLFVGIELPDDWRAALAELQRRQERLAPGHFRWVKPELMHLTVVFLGSQPLDRVGSLEHRLVEGAARTAPFELSLGRIGSFGRSGAPQVLWVEAVERSGALARLQDDLGAGFRSAGVELEAKPFRPHITLGRARGRRRGIELVATEPPRSTHRADRVTLFRSDLGQSGPTYTALAQAGLGAQV